MVRTMLDHNVNPPPPIPQIEEMQRRSQSYKSRVEARLLLNSFPCLGSRLAFPIASPPIS